MERYGLELAEPPFFPWDTVSHEITLCDPRNVLRFVSFVECNATLFSRSALETCRPTFLESETGAGIDAVWPKLLGYPEDKIALLDCVPCGHPRRRSELDRYVSRDKTGIHARDVRNRYGATAAMVVYKAVPLPFSLANALKARYYELYWKARGYSERAKSAVKALLGRE
jgi:hypothetical protein